MEKTKIFPYFLIILIIFGISLHIPETYATPQFDIHKGSCGRTIWWPSGSEIKYYEGEPMIIYKATPQTGEGFKIEMNVSKDNEILCTNFDLGATTEESNLTLRDIVWGCVFDRMIQHPDVGGMYQLSFVCYQRNDWTKPWEIAERRSLSFHLSFLYNFTLALIKFYDNGSYEVVDRDVQMVQSEEMLRSITASVTVPSFETTFSGGYYTLWLYWWGVFLVDGFYTSDTRISPNTFYIPSCGPQVIRREYGVDTTQFTYEIDPNLSRTETISFSLSNVGTTGTTTSQTSTTQTSSSTSSSSSTQTNNLLLTAYTEKNTYTRNELVGIAGKVRDPADLSDVKDATVIIRIFDAENKMVDSTSLTSDEYGVFTYVYTIPPDAVLGDWRIEIEASKEGYTSATQVLSMKVIGLYIQVMREIYEKSFRDPHIEPFDVTIKVTRISSGATEEYTTGSDGTIPLAEIFGDGQRVEEGSYIVRIIPPENNNPEWVRKWGTTHIVPYTGSGETHAPRFEVRVSLSLTGETILEIDRSFNVILRDSSGAFIYDNIRRGSNKIQLVNKPLEIRLRTIDSWENYLRNTIYFYLQSARVTQTPIIERVAYGTQTSYGHGGEGVVYGEFRPDINTILFELDASKFFSFDELYGLAVSSTLNTFIHEFGHQVKENILCDPGANLGGEHWGDHLPCSNVELAYDEGFANLFPILVTDWSPMLHKYVTWHRYDSSKYKGVCPEGKTGNYIEGRIAGLLLNLYGIADPNSGVSRADVLHDFIEASRVFQRMVGHPPRSIDQFIIIKHFLDPNILDSIREICSRDNYDIQLSFLDPLRGVMRVNPSDAMAFIVPANIRISFTQPVGGYEYSELNSREFVSVTTLLPGDSFISLAPGYDAKIYIRGYSAASSYMDWTVIEMKGHENKVGKLIYLGGGRMFVGEGTTIHLSHIGGRFIETIETPNTIITLHSEVVICVEDNETTIVENFRGLVNVNTDSDNLELYTGYKTSVEGDEIGEPQRIGSEEIWWEENLTKPEIVRCILTNDLDNLIEVRNFREGENGYIVLNLINVEYGDNVTWRIDDETPLQRIIQERNNATVVVELDTSTRGEHKVEIYLNGELKEEIDYSVSSEEYLTNVMKAVIIAVLVLVLVTTLSYLLRGRGGTTKYPPPPPPPTNQLEHRISNGRMRTEKFTSLLT